MRRTVAEPLTTSSSSTQSSSSSSSLNDLEPDEFLPLDDDEGQSKTQIPTKLIMRLQHDNGDGHHQNERQSNTQAPRKKGDSFQDGGAGGGLMPLFVCASGICACYLFYGVIQERLHSRDMQHVGSITTFLIASQTMTNSAVAAVWKFVEDSPLNPRGVHNKGKRKQLGGFAGEDSGLNHFLLLLTSSCYFVAMTASNEALNYASYPTVVLAKSSKLIPTMFVGLFVEQKSYSLQEWAGAGLITVGVIIFNLTRLGGSKDGSHEKKDSPYGLILLFLSLVMDGLLGSFQGVLKRPGRKRLGNSHCNTTQHRPPTAIETMLYVNLYATLFLLPSSVYTGHFSNGIKLLRSAKDTTVVQTIAVMNMTAAMGQIFIFFTIYIYSPLMCTTITTTRKFFTIVLSVRSFGHVFTTVQWCAVCMVFGGLYAEIGSKLSHERQKSKHGTASGTISQPQQQEKDKKLQ